MNEELERLLVDGNISWTAEDIRRRLSAAGYAIVRKEPEAWWVVPDYWGLTPSQFYAAIISTAEQNTQ